MSAIVELFGNPTEVAASNWRNIAQRKPAHTMTAKTILMQLHHKIQTFQYVNRKLVLVIQYQLLDYMIREFQFSHLAEPAVLGDAMHIHAYRAERQTPGFRLPLDRRLSTDADGIRAALGLQAEANLELAQIMRTLETRIDAATVFTPV